jgi:hypothetical protein
MTVWRSARSAAVASICRQLPSVPCTRSTAGPEPKAAASTGPASVAKRRAWATISVPCAAEGA